MALDIILRVPACGPVNEVADFITEAEQAGLAHRALDGGWTVRRLEDAVRAMAKPERETAKRAASPAMLGAVRRLESALGNRVEVRSSAKGQSGGRIVIHWYDEEQLNALASLMTGGSEPDEDDSGDFAI